MKMQRMKMSLVLMAGLACAGAEGATVQQAEVPAEIAARFEARVYADAGGEKLGYRFLKPKSYEAGKKYPLVLFLHGAGERGDNNLAQLKHGMRIFSSEEFQAKNPSFLVVPQVPANQKWSDVDWSKLSNSLPEKPSRNMRLAMEVLDGLQKEFSIDADRVYVTGISMGGYGTWDAISRWPDRFAAAVPICGGGDEAQAAKLTKLPIWCFHGDKDGAVPVARSRNMIAAIKAAGGDPKYTEYPGVGHNSWDNAYKDEALYDWLFAQKRSPK